MEGFHWLRIGGIVTLFVAAFYILLPTILQQDSDALLDKQSKSVQLTDGAVDLKLKYWVEEGELEEVLAVLKVRLAGDDDIARIQDSDGMLEVVLEVGAEPETVAKRVEEEALKKARSVSLHALSSLVELNGSDAVALEEIVALEAVQGFSGSVTEVPLSLTISSLTGKEVALSAAPEAESGPLAVVVDGTLAGVVKVAVNEEGVPGTSGQFASVSGRPSVEAAVAFSVFPGKLKQAKTTTNAEKVAETADTEEVEPSIPPWLAGLLPDTRMPLGLDLMGGIDLTLQVELDEALVAQAKRDSTYLIEQAKDEGLVIQSVDFDRYDPIIKLNTEVPAREIAAFFQSVLRADYAYYDTVNSGTPEQTHWFKMSSTRRTDVEEQSIKQVLDTVRRRVADIGVRDPVVVRKSGGKISVQLPGLTDLEGAVGSVSKTAVLEFRLVDEQFSPNEVRQLIASARTQMPEKQFAHDKLVNEWLWRMDKLPKDKIILWEYSDKLDEETGELVHERARALPLELPVILTGGDVNSADVGFDQSTQQANVSLNFKPKGASIFCEVTGERVGKRFAIILDTEIKSAPNIRERICGGRAQITMGSAINAAQEAKTLAVVLRTGSLDAPISIGDVRQVGPSLGKDAIRAGGLATIIGGSIVLIFMLVWYRTSGFIANTALILNVMLMLAGLSMFGWTLTLPGIAGIALTVGMAVDANIIIYERIREELKMGELPRKAVETGFQKAAVAVVDANITTAIAGVVLFSYGNVTIQGFAVTLLIGIGTTLITALFVTRSLLELVTRRSDAKLKI